MNSNIVIFIMGVSGVGKSTIGELLSEQLNLPFFDGDDFHPPSNILKMSNRQALTDEDRQPWLKALNTLAKKQIGSNSCIIACSALKQSYRELLSKGIEDQVLWVHLRGTFEQILERLNQRSDHFMPKELLQSQFDTLQHPDEAMDIEITDSPQRIVERIMERLPTG